MEFVIVIIVIAVLFIILGIKPIFLILLALLILWLLFAAASVFFFYFFFVLTASKKKSAYFVKIDKHPKSRFKTAYYLIEGKEYPNVFPEEGFMEKLLYKTNVEYHVRLSSKGFVFDRFSFATCYIGFILSITFFIGTFVFIKAII